MAEQAEDRQGSVELILKEMRLRRIKLNIHDHKFQLMNVQLSQHSFAEFSFYMKLH